MSHSSHRPSRLLGAVALVASLLVVASPAPATQTSREEPTGPPRVRIGEYMDRLRGQIQNTKTRFSNGIVGLDATHDGVAAAGPIARCCAQNLPRIAAAVRGIDVGMRELAGCYEQQGLENLRPAVELARSDLDALVVALRTLPTLDDESEVWLVLGGTTRAFVHLEKSVAELPTCDEAALGTSEVPPGS